MFFVLQLTCACFLTCSFVTCIRTNEETNNVLLISFDAFRHSYLNRLKELKNSSVFWSLIRSQNAWHDYDGTVPTFVSMTFPNHYGMVTGLYQESHGIISNVIYYRPENRTYSLTSNVENTSFLYNGNPIWRTALEQNISQDKIACYMFVACEYNNVSNFVKFDNTVRWTDTVSTIVSWLKSGVRLITAYDSQVDIVGHYSGPDSFEMNRTLIELDDKLEYLMDQLIKAQLLNNLNLIIVSDHGMIAKDNELIIPSRDDLYFIGSYGFTYWHVEPKPGKIEEAIAYLKTFDFIDVYRRSEIPEEWHYKRNSLVAEIFVLAKPGSVLIYPPSNDLSYLKGVHGYVITEPDMRGIFIGIGPDFRDHKLSNDENVTTLDASNSLKNHVDVSITDYYLLMCTILNLKPAPNNGSQTVVNLMINRANVVGFFIRAWLLYALFGIVICGVVTTLYIYRTLIPSNNGQLCKTSDTSLVAHFGEFDQKSRQFRPLIPKYADLSIGRHSSTDSDDSV